MTIPGFFSGIVIFTLLSSFAIRIALGKPLHNQCVNFCTVFKLLQLDFSEMEQCCIRATFPLASNVSMFGL